VKNLNVWIVCIVKLFELAVVTRKDFSQLKSVD